METCALYNEYGEPLTWTFTVSLGTCIYNTYDRIAFIVGWLSVLSWTLALLPQIVTNCKNQSAESQSFWFWVLWLAGDFCNLSGCILTHNLLTNTALAFVYALFTLFAVLQFIWYEFLVKRRDFGLKHRHTHATHQVRLLSDSQSQTTNHTHTQEQQAQGGMWNTPHFAARYASPTRPQSMTPQLRRTLLILSRSPRMFSVTPQLAPALRREYEAMQRQQRSAEHEHSLSGDTLESGSDHFAATREHSSGGDSLPPMAAARNSARMPFNQVALLAGADVEASAQTGPVLARARSLNAEKAEDPLSITALTRTHSVDTMALRTTRNPNYGSMQTIMSTLSSMSMTLVMLYGLNLSVSEDEAVHRSRVLLSEQGQEVEKQLAPALVMGMALGGASSLIYISSRIPQLRLMVRSKDVSGLNPAFFCLTFSGNVTQCLSMLVNRQIYTHAHDLLSKLPWLASSGICIFQDAPILFLVYLYSARGKHKGKDKDKLIMMHAVGAQAV